MIYDVLVAICSGLGRCTTHINVYYTVLSSGLVNFCCHHVLISVQCVLTVDV